MKNEIEFNLKQFTPLIHFNTKRKFDDLVDNKNETYLRATELKPKFDEFLRAYCKTYKKTYCKKNEIDIKQIKQSSSDALDYYIEIETKLDKVKEIDKYHVISKLFFGNIKPRDMDEREWEIKKKREVWLKNTKIKFFSFNTKLIDLIDKTFESFLASTNFATRSSKGFGCFYIDGKKFDKEKVYYIHKGELKKAKVYSFSIYPLEKNKYYKTWEEYLNLFYKFLRSGLNIKNKNGFTLFYTKPVIFEYFKSKLEWEKRVIKNKCLKNKLNEQIQNYPNSDVLTITNPKKRIIKDLFGLSTIESWRSYGKTLRKVSVEKKYKRFQSPLTFKYVDGVIYFWANESFEEILGKEFIISLGKCQTQLKIVEKFNFDDFFDFLLDLDLNKFINSKYHNKPEFKILSQIHNQLKALK